MKSEFIYGLSLGLILSGCQAPAIYQSSQWLIYENSRFGFTFPYPNDWVPARPPANADGQVFRDPQNPAISIRGWASYRVNGSLPRSIEENFQTEQGLWGELQIKIGLDISLMTLTLQRDEVEYQWQGEAPSAEFQNYYQFFYHVASRYRVEGIGKRE